MILIGDVLDMLRTLPDESVNCVATSPPYFGLRDYGVDGQIGLEKTPAEFVAKMVEVFEEVRRVLRKDGTCWVNLGDSYNGTGDREPNIQSNGDMSYRAGGKGMNVPGAKKKDLIGIPWRVAFALQDAGWYLRSEIIWAKPNPMPESVRDRPTKAHEQIFLLTKSPRYWYDADAIKEPASGTAHARGNGVNPKAKLPGPNSRVHVSRVGSAPKSRQNESFSAAVCGLVDERNARTVWEVATQPYKEAHFATFPPEIPKRCILAGCPVGGVVLDPFLGSGTTAAVAIELGRKWLGIELNPQYAELARKRIGNAQPTLEVA